MYHFLYTVFFFWNQAIALVVHRVSNKPWVKSVLEQTVGPLQIFDLHSLSTWEMRCADLEQQHFLSWRSLVPCHGSSHSACAQSARPRHHTAYVSALDDP